MADGPPNPAGPAGRSDRPSDWRSDDMALSAPSRRMVQFADALPDWLGSVRFRLTALYSLVLFGLAAFMVAGLYAVLANRLDEERVYRTYGVTTVERTPGGLVLTPTEVRSEYQSVEQLANARALGLLRSYSLSALGLLFLASLGVGWMVAGRVLAPIGRITAVARDIGATDLSRRIGLRGPPDELRELADTFDAMLARLDDALAAQQRFIQEASHELRNPLAVIRTNLDVALADPDASVEDLRRTAELVVRNATRMSTLVDDLVVYGRSGSPTREMGSVDLAAVVTESVEEFAAPARLRDLDVVGDAAPGLVVTGDRVALRRAVANLIANAVRLAPSGTTVAVGAGRDGERCWVAVADEGPGVPAEARDLVFQRFWRGDSAGAREEGRSGLGLAIVDQVARDHGGSVELADSAPGGSVFTVWLPAPAHTRTGWGSERADVGSPAQFG